jgi:hypothetical protein
MKRVVEGIRDNLGLVIMIALLVAILLTSCLGKSPTPGLDCDFRVYRAGDGVFKTCE